MDDGLARIHDEVALARIVITSLRRVGFYFELGVNEHREALRSARQSRPLPNEEKIIAYLEAGCAIACVMMVEEDVLADPPVMINPPNIMTDGVWAWPQTLAYYVQKYHVALPVEFVDQIARNGWKCPDNIDVHNLRVEGDQTVM
jgi:hypothetical protein